MKEEYRDIHDFEKRMASIEKTISAEENILDSNKKHIQKFIDYCHAKGQKLSTIHKDLYSLWFIAKNLDKDFMDCTKEDITKVLGVIQKQKWSDKTKRNHKVAVKKLWRIIFDMEKKGVYPPAVDWFETTITQQEKKLPDEILTEDDLLKLLNSCECDRDKAFIYLAYETGARIGELLNIKIKNIKFENERAYVMLTGKTGMRRIPIHASIPSLRDYLNNHVLRDDPDSSLFLMRRTIGKDYTRIPLSYNGARKLIRDIAKLAKVKKAVNPHAFRHACATRLFKLGVPEPQVRIYMGWTDASRMTAIYAHLSCRDLESIIDKTYGIKPKEEEKTKIGPKTCKRCNVVNEATSNFCKICGSPLDLKVALEMEEKLDQAREIDSKLSDDMYSQLKDLEKKFDKFFKEQGKKVRNS
ncbi:MAG: tyrosine-type recombinase/integrase [Candidatus Aenigmatarchaeota archaeon]